MNCRLHDQKVEYKEICLNAKKDFQEQIRRVQEEVNFDMKKVLKNIQEKAELGEVQDALNETQRVLSDQFKGFRSEMIDLQLAVKEELSKRLELKVNVSDLQERNQKHEK